MASEADILRFDNAVLFANGVDGVSRFSPDVKLAGMPGSRTLLVFFNNADAFYANPDKFSRWRNRVCIHRYNQNERQYFGWNRTDISKVVSPLPPMFLNHHSDGMIDGFFSDPVSAAGSDAGMREKRMSDRMADVDSVLPETECGATTGFVTAVALRRILPGDVVLVGFMGVQAWSVDSHDEDAEHRILASGRLGRFVFMEY